jgi:hypothetical protein
MTLQLVRRREVSRRRRFLTRGETIGERGSCGREVAGDEWKGV